MRAGGEKRGNAHDRRRRRIWMLATFDRDLGPERVRCWLQISDVCLEELDAHSLTVDRVHPEKGYVRDNIQPACKPCQNKQGALITHERRAEWLQWRTEADDRGIAWDGNL